MGIVLVVEDDDDLRDVICEMLARHGIEVLAARDGQDALDLLTSGVVPSLILLDLMMPRMSGWEFRRRQLANEKLAQVPVVVMTAASMVEGQSIPADHFLFKPLSLDPLIALVRRYVEPLASVD